MTLPPVGEQRKYTIVTQHGRVLWIPHEQEPIGLIVVNEKHEIVGVREPRMSDTTFTAKLVNFPDLPDKCPRCSKPVPADNRYHFVFNEGNGLFASPPFCSGQCLVAEFSVVYGTK